MRYPKRVRFLGTNGQKSLSKPLVFLRGPWILVMFIKIGIWHSAFSFPHWNKLSLLITLLLIRVFNSFTFAPPNYSIFLSVAWDTNWYCMGGNKNYVCEVFFGWERNASYWKWFDCGPLLALSGSDFNSSSCVICRADFNSSDRLREHLRPAPTLASFDTFFKS